MTQESESDQQFEFSIGWSAWIGMAVVYVLYYVAYDSRFRMLQETDAQVADFDRFLFPLIPVGILAGSVIIHEFAHAIAMMLNDIKVGKIQLEIWGGYTAPADDNPSLFHIPAKRYFAIFFAGPFSNFLVAGVIWMFALESPSLGEISSAEPFWDNWYLLGFQFNLIMAVFNLLPLFPLDGGHVLRSILMGLSGSAMTAGVVSGTFSLLVGTAYIRYIFAEVSESGWQALQSHALLALYAGIVVVASFAMTMVALFERSPKAPKSVNISQRLIAVVLVALLFGFGYALHFKGYWERLPLRSELFAVLFGS